MLLEKKGVLEGSCSQETGFPDSLRMSLAGLSVRGLVVSSVENFVEFVKQSEKLKPVGSSEGN